MTKGITRWTQNESSSMCGCVFVFSFAPPVITENPREVWHGFSCCYQTFDLGLAPGNNLISSADQPSSSSTFISYYQLIWIVLCFSLFIWLHVTVLFLRPITPPSINKTHIPHRYERLRIYSFSLHILAC